MIEQAARVCGGDSGHPGLHWIEELNLVSSAGIGNLRFGAFLYSNTCVVAGLSAAARLARALGKPDPAERWEALAKRIWEAGILAEAPASDPDAPGMVDGESGRFLHARRLSNLRGLWTSRPEFLEDRSDAPEVSLLGPAVPFGLLPASDARLRSTAEAILRLGRVSGAPDVLSHRALDPSPADPKFAPRELRQRDVSTLATLWMARYLIVLGRETGQVAHWDRAAAMLDAILDRLFPLGLNVRSSTPGQDGSRWAPGAASGVWGLHAMLVEAMLDLAGLDYDAPDRRLTLRPALPASWPHIGLSQTFACGLGRLPSRTRRRGGGLSALAAGPAGPSRDARCRADRPRADRADPLAGGTRDAPPPARAPGQPTHLDRRAAGRRVVLEVVRGLIPRRDAGVGPDHVPRGKGSWRNRPRCSSASRSGAFESVQRPRSRARSTTPFSRSWPKRP